MWSSPSNAGVSVLNEILGRVRLNDNLIRENNQVLHDFLRSFLDEMKRVDNLFNRLYTEPYYTGSYYSDLRISKPDEFDIDLILKLPFADRDFTIMSSREPNFVQYQSSNSGILCGALFEQGFLIPENVRTWFQSVIDKALRTYTRPRTIYKVYVREAGPARTITIVKNNGATIDVDLVPVIDCTLKLSTMKREVEAQVGKNLEAYLVPKPRYRDMREKTDASRLWRCHFPKAEEKIIYNMGCAKSVIKLLKFLRDEEKWSILASYYLKTVVMWMIVENSHGDDYWREDRMFDRFFQALEKLAYYVQHQKMPFLFNTDCNLIEKMNPYEAHNIHNRLNYFIRILSFDVNHLRRMF